MQQLNPAIWRSIEDPVQVLDDEHNDDIKPPAEAAMTNYMNHQVTGTGLRLAVSKHELR